MEVEVCTGCEMTANDFFVLSSDSSKLLEYLIKHGVVAGFKHCPRCGFKMKLCVKKSVFRCRKSYQTINSCKKKVSKQCDKSVSIFSGTLLQKSRIDTRQICCFIVAWLFMSPPSIKHLAIDFDMSKTTVYKWRQYLWNTCLRSLVSNIEKIGGLEKIVEIYEVKISHILCRCGRIANGSWLYGFLERDSRNCFLITVETNGPEILLPIIEKYINPGTTLVSDCWHNYNCLLSQGYSQLCGASCLNFVHPDYTGIESVGITDKWNEVERMKVFSRFGKGKGKLDYHIVEFLFRYRYPVRRERIHNIFTAISKFDCNCDVLVTVGDDKDSLCKTLSE